MSLSFIFLLNVATQCVLASNVAFDFSHRGKFNLRETRMADFGDGVCFLTGGKAFVGGGEFCGALLLAPQTWTLSSTSLQNNFMCSGGCLLGTDGTVGHSVAISGVGPQSKRLQRDSNHVCYLVSGRSWRDGSCEVIRSGGYWLLVADGERREHSHRFQCTARCARFPNQLRHVAPRIISGRTSSDVVLRSESTFCFLSHARGIGTAETCEVTMNGNGVFALTTSSTRDNFRCGATCVEVDGVYNEASFFWRQIAIGNEVSLELNYGASRTSGRTVSSTFGSSFGVSVTSPGSAIFGGITIDATVSQSHTTAITNSASVSFGEKIDARCPERPGNFAALYQFMVEAGNSFGVDRVATMLTRCHYSPNPRVPSPQCPFFACNSLDQNPLCQRSGCIDWRA